MKSFEQWFSEQGKEEELPEGIIESDSGCYLAQCKSCERWYEVFGTLEEFDPEYSYCGGNPWCCP